MTEPKLKEFFKTVFSLARMKEAKADTEFKLGKKKVTLRQIRKAVKTLPVQYGKAFRGHIMEGLTAREVYERDGIREPNVFRYIDKAVVRLYDSLMED